jgi:hypothetical protein
LVIDNEKVAIAAVGFELLLNNHEVIFRQSKRPRSGGNGESDSLLIKRRGLNTCLAQNQNTAEATKFVPYHLAGP